MRRRTFFNALGGAIIGTAIMLKLPESIAPVKSFLASPQITFFAMLDAYHKACLAGEEPVTILLSEKTLDDARELMDEHRTFRVSPSPGPWNHEWINFQNAVVVSEDGIADNEIITHSFDGRKRGFYFA